MLQSRVWAFAAFIMVAMAGVAVVAPASRSAAEDKAVVVKDHWRHHEGHWSYWHQGDRRWYYTDGSHWFYHDGDAWQIYPFDKTFGRDGFERGEYRVPGKEGKIVVPRHPIYRPR